MLRPIGCSVDGSVFATKTTAWNVCLRQDLSFLKDSAEEERTMRARRSTDGKATVCFVVCCLLIVVYLALTDPLRIQPWSQDGRNQTKSNPE